MSCQQTPCAFANDYHYLTLMLLSVSFGIANLRSHFAFERLLAELLHRQRGKSVETLRVSVRSHASDRLP
jgi:hypothetical protein